MKKDLSKVDILLGIIIVPPPFLILMWHLYQGHIVHSFYFFSHQLQSLYESNPIGTISMIASFIGVMLLYYGALVSSENKDTMLSGKIATYLKGLAFFTVIPTIFLLIVLFTPPINILFFIPTFWLLLHQVICYFKLFLTLKNRYRYDHLRSRIEEGVSERETWILHLIYVFVIGLDLAFLQISGIKLLLIGWLLFVSTTEIAIFASLQDAKYYLVDVKLNTGDEWKEAIYIREEGKDLIRIIPKPFNDSENYEGILLNRQYISSINFIRPQRKSKIKEKD